MKKNEVMKKTKNYVVTTAAILASVAMLAGCGNKQTEAIPQVQVESLDTVEETKEPVEEVETVESVEAVDTEETNTEPEASEEVNEEMGEDMLVGDNMEFDYPSSFVEERVGKTSFASYDEIIGLLEKDEAYALVNIKGYDGEVLLITNFTYDNLDGNMAAVEATPYTMKSTGKVTADSAFVSGGTANPIAIDADGVVYLATHTTMDKDCYGTNGTDDVAIIMYAMVYVDEFDDEGKPAKVGGFIRTKNTVIDNPGEEIASDDTAAFDKMFEEYGKAKVVNFTVVK